MNREHGQGRSYLLRGDVEMALADLEDFFNGLDWRPRLRGTGRIDFERGNRALTILLGGLAGRRFFLTAQIELREQPAGAEVRYRWGEGAGLALGGTLGRRRAARVHEETATALERMLSRGGRLLQVRPI